MRRVTAIASSVRRPAPPATRVLRVLRCVYVDLDGTLLGRAGSLLHDHEGSFTLLGVRALEACERAGVEVVPFSGRTGHGLGRDARLLGLDSYIFEAGAGVVVSGEMHWLTEERHASIEAAGGPALLLERYAGRLEYHEPWHVGREVSHLFRGAVDAMEADALLAEHGHEHLRLVDNGAIARTMPGIEQARAYHLVPRDVSKTRGLQLHQRIRGLDPSECIAIGDSREDVAAAAAVGTFWLVANGLERDPTIRPALAQHDNVRVAQERNGAGVYEAVVTTLAER
jgi:hydroxymethylpyrimidine pyrophosphatase-like HAD family hydrolase